LSDCPAFGMRLRSFLFLLSSLAVAALAHGADWRGQVNTRVGKHPLPRRLTAHYDFGWSGLIAADATAHFTSSKGRAQLELVARTTGLARALWRMDTRGVSTVNTKTLHPIQLKQLETYAKKSIATTVEFTPKGPTRLRVITPPDPEPPKPKTFKVGDAHDLHSAFLFARSQPLLKADVIRICVFPGSSPYLAEITVGEREKLRAAGKEWASIPCDIKLQEIEKDNTLAPYPKFKRAKVWLSDDADRLLLRIEADIFVGSIFAEMRDVQFEEGPAAAKR
jgi:hypothetical protein